MTAVADSFAEVLRPLVGIPWKEGGRTPAGMDCAGVTLDALKLLGIAAPDPWDDMAERWQKGELRLTTPETFPRGWNAVPAGEPWRRGDLLVWHKGGHVGAYAGGGWVLTSRAEVGSYLARVRKVSSHIEHVLRFST